MDGTAYGIAFEFHDYRRQDLHPQLPDQMESAGQS